MASGPAGSQLPCLHSGTGPILHPNEILVVKAVVSQAPVAKPTWVLFSTNSNGDIALVSFSEVLSSKRNQIQMAKGKKKCAD